MKTVTIGRQGLHLDKNLVSEIVEINSLYCHETYCDSLLQQYFGATKVDSIDNNAFEGASIIQDLNKPFTENVTKKFGTVIDAGCLEHIFNIPQALYNCSALCEVGGQIIHILPANNYCGHGFYQFSPELFFSLYSKKNGYIETEVYLASLLDSKKWWKVNTPIKGKRINIYSSGQVYILVRTVLNRVDFDHSNIHQSDYLYEWSEADTNADVKNAQAKKSGNFILRKIRFTLKSMPLIYGILAHVYHAYLMLRIKERLDKNNPDLHQMEIAKLFQ